MAQSTPPGISDLLGLFGGANPFGVITKSIGQFQRGVSDFLSAVENFNKTMEQMHGVAERVNGLLDTVEEPIKTLVPQITRDHQGRRRDGRAAERADRPGRPRPRSSWPTCCRRPRSRRCQRTSASSWPSLSDLARRLQPLGADGRVGRQPVRRLAPVRCAARGTRPPPAPAAPPATIVPVPEAAVAKTLQRRRLPPKKAPAKKAASEEGRREEGCSRRRPPAKKAAREEGCQEAAKKVRATQAVTALAVGQCLATKGVGTTGPAGRCRGRRRPPRCRPRWSAA